MHFYRRKISAIFTVSYANAVSEIFLEVNNRLREAREGKLGEARKTGEHGCQSLGGSSLKLVEGRTHQPSLLLCVPEVFGCD